MPRCDVHSGGATLTANDQLTTAVVSRSQVGQLDAPAPEMRGTCVAPVPTVFAWQH